MIYSVFDSETTIRNQGETAVGTFSGSPFHPDNFIVSYGELHNDIYKDQYDTEGVKRAPWWLLRAATGRDTMVVGHNIGFDLHYVRKHWPDMWHLAAPYVYIWDTQQVEYLLSGQSKLYPSLDECCSVRGLPLKDDRIAGYWDAGVDTTMIPKDELLDYQRGDVLNTHAVFLSQYEEVMANPSLRELVYVKMDDLLSTIEMTYNGMQFDLAYAAEKLLELDAEKESLYNMIVEEGRKFFPEDVEFSPSSGDHISLLLFGGNLKAKKPVVQLGEDGEPLRYKSGQKAGEVKTRIEEVLTPVKGYGLKPSKWDIPTLKRGYYSTDSEYLEKVEHPIIPTILRWRELEKDTETYYRGYAKYVWHDGRIHPNVNQESTRTGRQSMSNPNLQNVSKEEE